MGANEAVAQLGRGWNMAIVCLTARAGARVKSEEAECNRSFGGYLDMYNRDVSIMSSTASIIRSDSTDFFIIRNGNRRRVLAIPGKFDSVAIILVRFLG